LFLVLTRAQKQGILGIFLYFVTCLFSVVLVALLDLKLKLLLALALLVTFETTYVPFFVPESVSVLDAFWLCLWLCLASALLWLWLWHWLFVGNLTGFSQRTALTLCQHVCFPFMFVFYVDSRILCSSEVFKW